MYSLIAPVLPVQEANYYTKESNSALPQNKRKQWHLLVIVSIYHLLRPFSAPLFPHFLVSLFPVLPLSLLLSPHFALPPPSQPDSQWGWGLQPCSHMSWICLHTGWKQHQAPLPDARGSGMEALCSQSMTATLSMSPFLPAGLTVPLTAPSDVTHSCICWLPVQLLLDNLQLLCFRCVWYSGRQVSIDSSLANGQQFFCRTDSHQQNWFSTPEGWDHDQDWMQLFPLLLIFHLNFCKTRAVNQLHYVYKQWGRFFLDRFHSIVMLYFMHRSCSEVQKKSTYKPITCSPWQLGWSSVSMKVTKGECMGMTITYHYLICSIYHWKKVKYWAHKSADKE